MVNFELPSAVFSFKTVARACHLGSCDCHFKIDNELFTSVTWSLETRNQPYQYDHLRCSFTTTSLRTFHLLRSNRAAYFPANGDETSKNAFSIKRGKSLTQSSLFQ